MNSRILNFLPLFLVGIALIFPGVAEPRGVVVEPGEPEEIIVDVPPSAQAGVEFSLRLTVLDSEGNVVENYDNMDRTVELSTDRSGRLSKTVVESTEFNRGRATLLISYDLAEEITLRARESENVARGRSENINVRPGPPEEFIVTVPESVRAGEEFLAEIRVKDGQGNRVLRYREMTNGVILNSTGQARPSPEFIPAHRFHEGRARFNLTYQIAEEIELQVEDEVRQITGQSGLLSVKPAALSRFVISIPEIVRVGQPFRMAIEARDRFGNIVRNYDQIGGGVELRTTGEGEPQPGFIDADKFEDGVIFTRLTYDRAESFNLIVKDRVAPVEGQSGRMRARAGELAEIELETPGEAQAGEEFRVELTAFDKHGNRIVDFARSGDTLLLYNQYDEQQRRMVPREIFERGRAELLFSDTVARTTRLVVETHDQRLQTVGEQIRITPGSPAKLAVETPGMVEAGTQFSVRVGLYDQYGNKIKEPAHLTGELTAGLIEVEDPEDKIVSPRKFIDGYHQMQFRTERADTVQLLVEYSEYNITSKSDQIRVRPADFYRVAVRTPGQGQAGEKIRMTLQMLDRFGNLLDEVPEGLERFEIASTGSGQFVPRILSRENIVAPSFVVELDYFVAEVVTLNILNERGRQLGSSAPISIRPGRLARLNLSAPPEVEAGRSFPVRIRSEDLYGNIIEDISRHTGEIRLLARQTGDELGTVSFDNFIDGRVESSISHETAGRLELLAAHENVQTASSKIEVIPGDPREFVVAAPERVNAGVPFQGEITAYDRYGNRVADLPADFAGVQIRTSNAEEISPGGVMKNLFDNGRAEVFFVYPRTGRLEITAEPLAHRLTEPSVSRPYVQRQPDTARIMFVFSGNVNARIQAIETGRRVDVAFQPAVLNRETRFYSFDNWFIKRIAQQQVENPPSPLTMLQVFPREEVDVSKTVEKNLLVLEFGRRHLDIPTLERIHDLIEGQQFEEAQIKLHRYLEQNPDDPYAIRLRHRIERIQEILSL